MVCWLNVKYFVIFSAQNTSWKLFQCCVYRTKENALFELSTKVVQNNQNFFYKKFKTKYRAKCKAVKTCTFQKFSKIQKFQTNLHQNLNPQPQPSKFFCNHFFADLIPSRYTGHRFFMKVFFKFILTLRLNFFILSHTFVTENL